ncbi:MAG: hypothetical protein RL217_17 [Pseudomonadota bacterium]|jgi:type IV pilus assembly protein PilV
MLTLYAQRGINMVEILVTLVITAVGLLGLNSLQLQSNRAALDSGSRSQAAWVLEDLANRIRANPSNKYSTGVEPDEIADQDGNNVPNPDAGKLKTVDCSVAPSKKCSAYYDGSRVAGSVCTAEEQAIYDLKDVACSKRNGAGDEYVFRDAIDFMANPKIAVGVNGKLVTLNISWDVRTGGVDASGNKVYANKSSNITQHRDSLTTTVVIP